MGITVRQSQESVLQSRGPTQFWAVMPNQPLIIASLFLILAAVIGGLVSVYPVGAVYLLLLLLLLITTWRFPAIPLAGLTAVPFIKSATEDLVIADLTVVLAVACICAAVFSIVRTLPKDFGSTYIYLLGLGALSLVITVGIAWAPDQASAREGAIRWGALVAMPFLLIPRIATNPQALRQFLYFHFGIGFAITALGFKELASGGVVGRLSVIGSNPLDVARAAFAIPILTMAWLWPSNSRLRWVGVACSLPALVVAASTGSRGTLLFGVVTIVFVWLALGIRRWSRYIIHLALGALLVVGSMQLGVMSWLPPIASERFSSLLLALTSFREDSIGTLDVSTQARLEAYSLAQSMFSSRPVTGWGTSGFKYLAERIPSLAGLSYPHNLLLQVAAEYGIVGLMVLITLLLLALRPRRLEGDPSTTQGIAALLFFNLLCAMTSYGIIENRLLWALLFIRIATPQLSHVVKNHRV